jgi:NAD(P)-dependent dehydrogenase (short-subunit alcohol dehydrogenase family)
VARGALAGQVAVVTGASSGIGAALARALAAQGARVALAARSAARLEALAAKIAAAGGEALAVATDVTDPAQVSALVQRVEQTWGRLDILIANAGTYVQVPTAELTLDALQRGMEINFFGAMGTALAALPLMRRQRSGHLVFMASQAAFIPIPPDGPYAASKAALSGIAQVMRQELAPEGIAVTVVYPGRIETPLIRHLRMPWISPKASPERLARLIVGAIRGRRRRLIYPVSGYLYILRELWPALGDWLIGALHLQGWPAPEAMDGPSA